MARTIISIFGALLISILFVMLMAAIIGGVFGLLWKAIANLFGFKGTAEEALKALGTPGTLLSWVNAAFDFVYRNIIKPFWDWLKSLWGVTVMLSITPPSRIKPAKPIPGTPWDDIGEALSWIAIILLIILGVYVVYKINTIGGMFLIFLALLWGTMLVLGTTALIILKLQSIYDTVAQFFNDLEKQWQKVANAFSSLRKAIENFFSWLWKTITGQG